ncbi:hypothetical protein [Floridanema aerugineum]|uniref:Uncharacterized protein n=1 Tax=Floridaenema aerugineum BLCC-F46 TaxID=3153654 RepID=A0ABV4XCH4_9CYAN
MNELINDPLVQDFISSFFAGEVNLETGLVWLGIAIAFSILGGAIGGILLAGKDLGYRLSAMIGGLFGPAAIIPATVLGLIVLAIN